MESAPERVILASVEKLPVKGPRDVLQKVSDGSKSLAKVSINNDAKPLAPEISWFELIKNGLYVELAQKVGNYFGGTMNNDSKTTILGFFAALFGVLKLVGIVIEPAPWLLEALAYACIAGLGYFTNKKTQQ